MRNIIHPTLNLGLGIALCAALFSVQAGPPLICHPYDIGTAQSLPWQTGENFNNPDPAYNLKQLADDTLRILDRGAPVLVRMETMRRAALYGAQDHAAARSLLASLRERTAGASPTALALFDYGYFTESIKQLGYMYKEEMTSVDGYPFVQRAVALEPGSAEIHFAAAIIARYSHRPDYADHARKAKAGMSDTLLARNINSHLE